MAKTGGDNRGKGQNRQPKQRNARPAGGPVKPEGGETTAGYFRRVFAENPKRLDAASNKEMLDRWLQDHPGEKEVPNNVKANLANIKSVLRKQGRKRQARRDAAAAAGGATAGAAAPPRAPEGLERLEEHIDEGLTLAKNLDREGLDTVIQYLRQARNLVVWKMGK
jgi:hypothetical protein